MTSIVGQGYIYIKGWDRFQHPDAIRSSHMPWLKLHTDLLGNDAWLDLCDADRVLLQGLWMLTSRYGNGRIKADTKWLCGQLKVNWSGRYRGLERLSDAGFIEVLASKAASNHASKVASTEEEGSYEPKKESARANGAGSRRAFAARQKQITNSLAAARAVTAGEPPHLAEDIIRKGFDEDIVPDILQVILPELKRVDL